MGITRGYTELHLVRMRVSSIFTIYIIIALKLARLDSKGFLLAARWVSLLYAKCAYTIPILVSRLEL